jgi:hypothetical protein
MATFFANRKLCSLAGLALAALTLSATGCQIVENGQTLPSPYYQFDDVQYFAPGPEFPISNEAAAQKAYKAEEEARAR